MAQRIFAYGFSESGDRMKAAQFVSFVLKLGFLFVTVLLTVQNMSRTSELSLDLYFFGAQFSQPQPVPYLVWSGFFIGGALGVAWSLNARKRAKRRIRDLESSLVRQELGKIPEPVSDGWS